MNRERKYELLLAWCQICGGMLGIGILLWIPITMPLNFFIQHIILIAGMLTQGFSICCVIMILKKRKNALTFSYINQCFQILKFSVMGFGFHYVSGLSLLIGIELNETIYILEAGSSSWFIQLNSDSVTKEININIMALLIILLIDYIKKIKRDKDVLSIDID